jgi:hypothetical protein
MMYVVFLKPRGGKLFIGPFYRNYGSLLAALS